MGYVELEWYLLFYSDCKLACWQRTVEVDLGLLSRVVDYGISREHACEMNSTVRYCVTCAMDTVRYCVTCVMDTARYCVTCVMDTVRYCVTCVMDSALLCHVWYGHCALLCHVL